MKRQVVRGQKIKTGRELLFPFHGVFAELVGRSKDDFKGQKKSHLQVSKCCILGLKTFLLEAAKFISRAKQQTWGSCRDFSRLQKYNWVLSKSWTQQGGHWPCSPIIDLQSKACRSFEPQYPLLSSGDCHTNLIQETCCEHWPYSRRSWKMHKQAGPHSCMYETQDYMI